MKIKNRGYCDLHGLSWKGKGECPACLYGWDGQEIVAALESLTPGGSEFVGDPWACLAWIERRLKAVGELAAERNQMRALLKDIATTVGFLLAESNELIAEWSEKLEKYL